jgi:hypothetical protein
MLFTNHMFFSTGGRRRGLHQVKLDTVVPLGLDAQCDILPSFQLHARKLNSNFAIQRLVLNKLRLS